MMPEPVLIHDPEQIDLGRHAVIEASAGTGKTFTIESLVVRLIRSGQATLDQLLVVTFTEKATGELRTRIRSKLHDALQDGRPGGAALQLALDTFDGAAISTIHGFCQRVLQQFAFENGQVFQAELTDDALVYHAVLRELQRRDWRDRFGDELAELLACTKYPYPKGQSFGAKSWEDLLIGLAQRYRPDDRLVPAPLTTAELTALRGDLAAALAGARQALTQAGLATPWAKTLPAEYLGVKGRRANVMKAAADHVLAPVGRLLDEADLRQRRWLFEGFLGVLEAADEWSSFGEEGFPALTGALSQPATAPAWLRELVTLLEPVRQQFVRTPLRHQLLLASVPLLQERVATWKRAHGLVSYDDLLTRVADALNEQRHPGAPVLLRHLRDRYHYALVDEFQDTDPIQWSIFRRIFLHPGHRLFIIGDPKQAIYSFRGADLNTYLGARQELLARHGAQLCQLPVNRRCGPQLIAVHNELFRAADWFADVHETFPLVEAAAQPAARIVRDDSGRAPLNVFTFATKGSGEQKSRTWARSIAAEIQRLLLPTPKLTLELRGRVRDLRADDVCVLVRATRDARPIQEELARLRLPYSFYKQSGVHESSEAQQLGYLLTAVARPDDRTAFRRALLTRFFACTLTDLEAADAAPPDHPIRLLLAQWQDLARRRRWPLLFQSILEDTGLLRREISQPEGDRTVTNYQHLVQELAQEAIARKQDLPGLMDYLCHYAERRADPEDPSDLQRLETEFPKVQLMTIHKSKGLEFPIVFLGGGFSRPPHDEWNCFHDQEQRVFSFADDGVHDAAAGKERCAETQRLLYVAITRAMCQVYVPACPMADKKLGTNQKPATPPPAGLLSQALDAAWEAGASPLVRYFDGAEPSGAAAPEPGDVLAASAIVVPAPAAAAATAPLLSLPAPLLPPQCRFDQRRLVVTSYSGLAARERELQPESAEALDHGADDALSPSPQADADELPHTAATGSMLHQVFEQLDFAAAFQAPDPEALAVDPLARPLFQAALADWELAGEHEAARLAAAAKLVWTTLHTPLPAGCCLGQVPASDRRQEVEFCFPVPPGSRGTVPETTRTPEGLILGYIDLVFRYGGRYFLADWKSSYLEDGYGSEVLARDMAHADYHLQRQLYTVAVHRWLGQTVPGYDLARHFGGVLYLYLRGLNGHDDTAGVYFQPAPTAAALAAFEQELATRFGQAWAG